MNFFLHINQQVKGRISKEKFVLRFFLACFSYRLSPRLIIDRRITKFGTNNPNHVYNTGLKSCNCKSKMATKNPRWPPRNSFFFYIFASWFLESDKTQRTKKNLIASIFAGGRELITLIDEQSLILKVLGWSCMYFLQFQLKLKTCGSSALPTSH